MPKEIKHSEYGAEKDNPAPPLEILEPGDNNNNSFVEENQEKIVLALILAISTGLIGVVLVVLSRIFRSYRLRLSSLSSSVVSTPHTDLDTLDYDMVQYTDQSHAEMEMIVPIDSCPHGTLRAQKPPKGILKNSRTTDCLPGSPMSDIVVTYSEKQFLGGRETGPQSTQTLGRNHTFSNTGCRPAHHSQVPILHGPRTTQGSRPSPSQGPRPSPNQGPQVSPGQGARPSHNQGPRLSPSQGTRPSPSQGPHLSSFSVPTPVSEVCPGSPAHSILHRPVPDLRHTIIANQDVRLSPVQASHQGAPTSSFQSQTLGASPTIVISRPGAVTEPEARLQPRPFSSQPDHRSPDILVEQKSESKEQLFVL